MAETGRLGPALETYVELSCLRSQAPRCRVRCVSRPAFWSRAVNVAAPYSVPQELLANAEARLAGVRAKAGWGARLGSFLAGSFVTRIVRNLSVTVRESGLPAMCVAAVVLIFFHVSLKRPAVVGSSWPCRSSRVSAGCCSQPAREVSLV